MARSLNDNRKQSLYFTGQILETLQKEAHRMDRSLSWMMQRAWEIALPTIRKMPGATQ